MEFRGSLTRSLGTAIAVIIDQFCRSALVIVMVKLWSASAAVVSSPLPEDLATWFLTDRKSVV